MSLEQVLNSVVSALSKHGIPYAVMCGLAVRVYAIPRFTNDVDITIDVERDELSFLFESLQSIGCEVPTEYRNGWLDTVAGLPLFKVDYLAERRTIEVDMFVAETPFQLALIKRRRAIELEGEEISFVSPEDLILLKLIASRPRDLIDVQDILFTMGELDLGYLRSWAKMLSIDQELEHAISQYDQQGSGQ